MTLHEQWHAAFCSPAPVVYIGSGGIEYRAIPERAAADAEASGAYVMRLPRCTLALNAAPDPNDRDPLLNTKCFADICARYLRETFRIIRGGKHE